MFRLCIGFMHAPPWQLGGSTVVLIAVIIARIESSIHTNLNGAKINLHSGKNQMIIDEFYFSLIRSQQIFHSCLRYVICGQTKLELKNIRARVWKGGSVLIIFGAEKDPISLLNPCVVFGNPNIKLSKKPTASIER